VKTFRFVLHLIVLVTFLAFGLVRSATAFNYVADGNGTYWGIQDAASPGVDTGSIRATQAGFGLASGYSTSINGFGGIRVLVQKA
jgi:amidase